MRGEEARRNDIDTLEVARDHPWRCTDIKWKIVLKGQHWGTLVACVPGALGSGLIYWAFGARSAPFSLSDPRIDHPDVPDIINPALIVLLPFIALFVTVAIVEFGLLKRFQSVTLALTTFLHVLIDAVAAWVLVIFLTQFMNAFTGAPRPSFLSRCKPNRNVSGWDLWKLQDWPCTNENTSWVSDGRKSFPSGHAAVGIFFATYSAVYVFYRLYVSARTRTVFSTTCCHRVRQEFYHAIWMFWILVQLLFAWSVGITRYLDHHHSLMDVTAGLLFGFTVGVFFSVRSIGMLPAVVVVNDRLRVRASEVLEEADAKHHLDLADCPTDVAQRNSTHMAATSMEHSRPHHRPRHGWRTEEDGEEQTYTPSDYSE